MMQWISDHSHKAAIATMMSSITIMTAPPAPAAASPDIEWSMVGSPSSWLGRRRS